MFKYRDTGEVLREIGRYFVQFGLVGGGVVAGVLYGVAVVRQYPLGMTALVIAMAGVLVSVGMWGGASDAMTTTAAETAHAHSMRGDSGDGVDTAAAAWSDIVTDMQVVAFVAAGVAFYGFVGMFVFAPIG